MSGNPLPQTQKYSAKELELIQFLQIQYGLSLAEILMYAEQYEEARGCDILDAFKVMLEGNDIAHAELSKGDEAWSFYYVAKKGYVWDRYEVGGDNDPNLGPIDDSKPSDFPEYYLSY